MSKKFINVRFQSVNKENTRRSLSHDFRTSFNKNIIRNNNNNFYYFDDKQQSFNHKDMRKEVLKKVSAVEKKHEELHLENQSHLKVKRKLRRNRVNSVSMGVLTFSSSITDDLKNGVISKNDFVKMGIDNIKEMMREFERELIYVCVHFDEKTPHFHFQFSNYQPNGKVQRLTKKQGARLQDIGEKGFDKYGYIRGIEKEVSGNINKNPYYMRLKENEELNNIKKSLEKKIEDNREILNKELNPILEKQYLNVREKIRRLTGVNKEYKEMLTQKNVDLHKNIKNMFYKKEIKMKTFESILEEYKELKILLSDKDIQINYEKFLNSKSGEYLNTHVNILE